MRSMAAEINRDRAAVVAALAYEWSNGTTKDFAHYNFRSSFSILGD
jgi:hypothetical protein